MNDQSDQPAVFVPAGTHRATIQAPNGEKFLVGCGGNVIGSQYGMLFCPTCDRMIPKNEVTK